MPDPIFQVEHLRLTYPARRGQPPATLLDDVSGPMSQVRPEFRAGATFFASFRSYVGAGFFSSAMGWRDLKYVGNVFNPNWTGCPQPALDKLGVSYDLMNSRVAPQR